MNFWNLTASRDKAGAKSLDITVYGDIEGFFDGVSSGEIAKQLADHKDAKTITQRINSRGGDVFAGVAIYNAIASHGAQVTSIVEGLAGSAASLIAMAGKTVMRPSSMLMAHNPWTVARGDANALRETADNLDKVRDAILPIYRAKTGKTDEEIKAILDAETWFTAEQAVSEGFADEVAGEKVKARASADQVFFGAVGFARERLEPRILAMVVEPAAPPPSAPNNPAPPEGEHMLRNPLLLAAVGLPDDADEPTFDGRIEALATFEREVCAKLGVSGPDEVLAKVTEAAAALVELPQLRAQIGAAQADSRKRDLRASLEGGLYQRKLNLGTIARTLPRLVADKSKREKLSAALGAVKITTRASILDAACSVDITDDELDNIKDYIKAAPLVSPDPVREPSREAAELKSAAEADAKLLAERMAKVDEEIAADPTCTPSVARARAAAKHKQLFADGVGVNPSEKE